MFYTLTDGMDCSNHWHCSALSSLIRPPRLAVVPVLTSVFCSFVEFSGKLAELIATASGNNCCVC